MERASDGDAESTPKTVRPEPVEGCPSLGDSQEKGQGFDKLSPNGDGLKTGKDQRGLAVFLAVPGVIAMVRKHPERQLIYKLSPLSVFSFILWGALIVWASSDRRDDAVISKYVAKLRQSNRLPIVIGLLVLVGLLGGLVAFFQ